MLKRIDCDSKLTEFHFRISIKSKEKLHAKAKACNMTAGQYVRLLCDEYEPKSCIDMVAMDELLQVNADLGRLGGLLKLWLTDDLKLTYYSKYGIKHLINKIENTRDVLEQKLYEILAKQ